MLFDDVSQSVGLTPLVGIPSLSPPGYALYLKLEGANPTGSVKDRVAKYLIEAAEADGTLAPGQRVLEPTSGNTGISLAAICAPKGHPLTLVMPDNTSQERKDLLAAYGAEVVGSPATEGSNGAVRLAREMAAADPSVFMPFQYGNPGNPLAHYETTAPEIIADLPDLAAFVAGLGTGGTLTGAGRRLAFPKRHPGGSLRRAGVACPNLLSRAWLRPPWLDRRPYGGRVARMFRGCGGARLASPCHPPAE